MHQKQAETPAILPWHHEFGSTHAIMERMKVQCLDCGKLFSIEAAQLGTRGRCPHCKTPVQMPASVDQVQTRRTLSTPDPRYLQRTLLAAAVILLHAGGLLLMACLPWYSAGQQSAEVEHHFVLPTPEQPRLRSFPLPQLQPVPLESLIEPLPNRLQPLPTPRQRIVPDLKRNQERFGDPVYAQRSSDGAPDFIASAAGGPEAWDRRSAQTHPLIPTDTFDELLTRLSSDGLDLAIVFDSTASMNLEIDQVKNGIEQMGETLFRLVPKTRISICTYRDQGDQYVTKGLPLSASIAQVVTFLNEIQARGGGDKSESVTAGIKWVIENNRFRSPAKKVILIFGDAPPKPDQWLTCQRLVSDFRFGQRGIVSTVTCHRRSRLKSFIEIAQLGGGESFLNRDETKIVQQLLVLVFGSRYRSQILHISK